MARFLVKPKFEEEIVRSQLEDPELRRLAKKVRCKRRSDYVLRKDGVLLKDKRLYVPQNKALKDNILEKAHSSAYAMHPGSTKMYKTLKTYY